MDEIKEIIKEIVKFRNERDWEQFHDSKNLATAISIEGLPTRKNSELKVSKALQKQYEELFY